MVNKGLIIDTENCAGCLACEIACKQEHDLPVGPRCIRVARGEPVMIRGKLRLRYDIVYCLHCKSPLCREACPSEAIIKRDDGVVLIDENACTGCGACVDACPLGMIQFNNEKNTALKCDYCVHRTDKSLPPACAAACISHCIYFGDIDNLTRHYPELGTLLQDIKTAHHI